jgi:hypothetical protein
VTFLQNQNGRLSDSKGATTGRGQYLDLADHDEAAN